MIRYLIRRVLYAIPILIGVSLLTFILFFVVASPESVARRNLSVKNPSPKQINDWIKDHGYDKPMVEQFKSQMGEMFTFKFGNSDRTKESINDRIKKGAGPSAMLAGCVLVTALLISLTVAVLAAYFRGTYVDSLTTVACVVLMSVVYVVYVIGLQFVLGKLLRYGPLAGYQPGASALRFIILPAIVGLLARIGSDIRLYRTFLLDEIGQDYVRTARAKGVSERVVLFKHVLKNAMIPVITTTVSSIPLLILGSIILETFFGIPGLGSYLQDAVTGQDFPVVRAMVYMGTILYIFGLILTDVLYAAIDPRVRLE